MAEFDRMAYVTIQGGAVYGLRSYPKSGLFVKLCF